jgi:hypothetical protein
MSKLKPALIALVLSVPPSAIAQDGGRQVVPVERAPFHVTMFSNEYGRLLNVYIPAGRTASYHKHSTDVVYTFVQGGKIKNQPLGGQPTEPRISAGAVNFVGYTKNPAIHQVSNIDTQAFHVVGFEITYPEPGCFSPSSRAEVPAYKQVLEHERVRGWRVVLEPGESIPPVTQGAPGFRVIVSGGELVESEKGLPDRDMILRLGEFSWQELGATRSVRNAGANRIEFVEFELK